MILTYNKSYSTVKPEVVDDHSSSYVTYLRKNIIEKESTDEFGNTYTMYEYDECILTKEEYQEYLIEIQISDIEQQRADIDYIAFMCDIEL